MAEYSDSKYKQLASDAIDDLNKVKIFLQDSPDKEAQQFAGAIQRLVDDGNHRFSDTLEKVVNNKFFNIRYYPRDGLTEQVKQEEESRIKRLRSYLQWLGEYERRKQKKDAKDPVKKTKSKKEEKNIKQIEKVKKQSDSLVIKTAKQAARDFINSQDNNYKKAVYDFQTRWDNNNEKVGNVFSQNYQQLKQDFQRYLIQGGGPYLKKAAYYRSFANRYGLDEIAESALQCAIKRTPFGTVAAAFNEVQETLNNFRKGADTVITESLNIADNLIGIAEEVRDTKNAVEERKKKIKNQYKDYKGKLKEKKVPTKNDVKRNQALQQFARTLLPIITTKVSNIISLIIDNACTEDNIAEIAIPSLIDRESFQNSLRDGFGFDADTGDEYLAMLQDISGFLTPVEICRLFNGESSDQVLDSILYFISIYYKKIFIQLGTTIKIEAFFVFIGQLVDPSFCKEIEFSSLGDDFCFEPDSYQAQLRECLIAENPDLLGRLTESYTATKKQQIKDLLEFSFYPFELRGEQQALNEIFNREDARRREEPLLELAGEYEAQYNQSLLNMPRVFIKEQERTEVSATFQENLFADSLDALPKEQREALNNQIPARITRLERHILPSFSKFMFLKDNESSFDKKDPIYNIEKKYSLLPIATRNLRNVTDSLLLLQQNQKGINQINLDLDHIYFNPAFQIPDYSDSFKTSFSTSKGKYKSTQVYDNKSFYLYPGKRLPGELRGGGATKANSDYPEISANTEFEIRNKNINISSYSERSIDALDSYSKFLDKAGHKVSSDKKVSYNVGFKDTYNKLVNICMNSAFAKKIPIGLAGPSDNGNVSGLEVVKIGQDLDPECSKNSIGNFGTISFKRDAKQAARTDITDFVRVSLEDEEDEIREKYFNNIMSFKTHVLDFITKSIFLFSQFNFEKDEVDDSMIDYVYIEYYKSLVEKDIQLNATNFEFESLTDEEKTNFVENIYTKQDVAKLLAKYRTELSLVNGQIVAETKEASTSKKLFEDAKKKIEDAFVRKVLDGALENFLYVVTKAKYGEFSPIQLKENILKSGPYTRYAGNLSITIPNFKTTYNSFINRLDNIINRTLQLGKDIGYLIFDMENAKLKNIKDSEIATRIEEGLGNGGLDDVLDDLYKDAEQWNKDWEKWHKDNPAPSPISDAFDFTETYRIKLSYINFKTNLWSGGHVVKGVTTIDFAYVDSILDLRNQIQKDLQTYAKEFKEFVQAEREAIALGNRGTILQNIVDELADFKKQQDNIKYNISYDTSRSLLHYHNENYPKDRTDNFCEAVRNLIMHEISNSSKILKEIIYTPQMRGERIFNINDRMIEKQLNIFHSKNANFIDDISDQMKGILDNTVAGEYPYFDSFREIDGYMDDFLPSVVKSQVGQTHFHMTKVTFDPSTDKEAKVDIYLCRNFNEEQLKKSGISQQDISSFSAKGEKKKVIYEKDFIKKTYTKYNISEQTAESRLSLSRGSAGVDIAKEVQKLFTAMDGVGTYESQIFGVLQGNKPEDVVRIQKLFNAVFINVEGYGTLEESLRDELSGRALTRALKLLSDAYEVVRAQGGLKAGAFNFVRYPDFNNLPDDPFGTQGPTDFGSTFLGALGAKPKDGTKPPVRNDRLYRKGFRWISNAKYPAGSYSQYFGRKQWKIDDYKHREDDTPSKFEHTLYRRDYGNNPKITAYLKNAAREIVPNYISIIDDFKSADIYFGIVPVLSIKVNAENYKDFVDNYKKANNDQSPTMQQYINHCLKHAIVTAAKNQIFENDNFGSIYSNAFPLPKMLSHIAINMNKYVTYINSVQVGVGDNLLPNRIKSLRGLEDFSFFNLQNLSGLGLSALATGLSLADMDRVRVANQNLSVGDIIQLTQSVDNTVYFIKSTIKYFLRNLERADLNIQVSKLQADAISKAIRSIYAKARLIATSAEAIARVFGADTPGKGIPSATELDTQFKGMRYLFNLPVTPFAVANWFPGGLVPSSIQAWISYVLLESTLITIELLEDYGAIEELKKLLFGDGANNPISAPGFNYAVACQIEKEEALKLNPIVQKNLKTSGGEYLLPDGREYIGEYHIHKDGTVMVGGEHPTDIPTVILTEIVKRDDIDV